MRNIFDQYSQPENRLTHALMTVLDKDRKLLRSFLHHFSLAAPCAPKDLCVREQTAPGFAKDIGEEEAERRGLPDGLIYNAEAEWALVLECKISAGLTRDQLRRHIYTIGRCGFKDIQGMVIALEVPSFVEEGWHCITWRDVYIWACREGVSSSWAVVLVDYFNIAEAKMTQQKYLKEGTITEFSGINLDHYSYMEGKRVLRLLMQKLKQDRDFVKQMGINTVAGRGSITDDAWGVWDYITFREAGENEKFTLYPHITLGFSAADKRVDVMITFPHNMVGRISKNLVGKDFEEFDRRVKNVYQSIEKNLRGIGHFQPVIRVIQRRYKGRRGGVTVEGEMNVELRTCYGGVDPVVGKQVKIQPQWIRAVHSLFDNKKSNMQMQIGVMFSTNECPAMKDKDADQVIRRALLAMRPMVEEITGWH